MTHAFHEIYLNKAQSILGQALDYAVNTCGLSGSGFIKLFLASSACAKMEKGEPACLAGKTGIEIAREIYAEATGKQLSLPPEYRPCRSAEYWCGWAAAYYQWYSDRSYQDIFRAIPFEDFLRMYPTLHEADITKFAEAAEARMREIFPDTNLKRLRTAYGCSQAELARGSGVSLRCIQMYEQRNKDINRASAENLYRLAKFLGCTMENLIEH